MKHDTSFTIFTRNSHRRKIITRKKVKFFEVINIREIEKTIKDICEKKNISHIMSKI